ncbi:MAG: hypothetical protein WC334_06860 [Kiritimatiellales bacterium]
MDIKGKEFFAVTGNSNHIPSYLDYFESNIEQGRCLIDSPNYYAWLCIASERVLYRLREMIFFNEKDPEIFDCNYRPLIDRAFSNYSFDAKDKESILLFAKIRHIIVHKGFPNPHEIPSSNERSIANGTTFGKAEVWELVRFLRSPANFHDLKEKYDKAIRSICEKEKSGDHYFGSVTVKRG